MSDAASNLALSDCVQEQRENFVAQMRSVPGAVALICSSEGDSRTGMAATAWNSLCADPPMLLVCVNREASVHGMINRSRKFSVNLLSTEHVETVAIFSAQRGLSGGDRFLMGKWKDGLLGQPLFVDAVASFECDLEGSHSYGTHDIFIGRVRHLDRGVGGKPLLYLNGKYCEPASVRTADTA